MIITNSDDSGKANICTAEKPEYLEPEKSRNIWI